MGHISPALGLLTVLLLAGCAVPMPREQSGPPPAEVAARQSANVRVSWGGVVVRTDNFREGTRLEVLAHPLETGGKPLVAQPSQGRFLAYTAQFLEPLDFAPGRIVSVEGWVRRVETGQPAVSAEQSDLPAEAGRAPSSATPSADSCAPSEGRLDASAANGGENCGPGGQEYRYPLVEITKIRLWPKYMADDRVRLHIGIGFGVGL